MHKITQWGEYGIHVMLHIAHKNHEGQKLVTALQIAESQNISINYTQQILMRLRQGNLIESARGPKGGFFISQSPSEITLRKILEISEGETAEVICETNPLKHDCCSKEANCYLKSVWYGLRDVINSYLDKVTLQDLLDSLISEKEIPLVSLNRAAVA